MVEVRNHRQSCTHSTYVRVADNLIDEDEDDTAETQHILYRWIQGHAARVE